MRRSAFPEVLFWSGVPEALAAVPDLRNPPQHFSVWNIALILSKWCLHNLDFELQDLWVLIAVWVFCECAGQCDGILLPFLGGHHLASLKFSREISTMWFFYWCVFSEEEKNVMASFSPLLVAILATAATPTGSEGSENLQRTHWYHHHLNVNISASTVKTGIIINCQIFIFKKPRVVLHSLVPTFDVPKIFVLLFHISFNLPPFIVTVDKSL